MKKLIFSIFIALSLFSCSKPEIKPIPVEDLLFVADVQRVDSIPFYNPTIYFTASIRDSKSLKFYKKDHTNIYYEFKNDVPLYKGDVVTISCKPSYNTGIVIFTCYTLDSSNGWVELIKAYAEGLQNTGEVTITL
jgi:hypothetical protein